MIIFITFHVTVETVRSFLDARERRWCSGIMQDSHSCDPGSIPGRRTAFKVEQLTNYMTENPHSRALAQTVFKNAFIEVGLQVFDYFEVINDLVVFRWSKQHMTLKQKNVSCQ